MTFDYSPLIDTAKGELKSLFENALAKRKLIRLRDYQNEAVGAVLDDWCGGLQSVLLTISTGGGKTEIFLGILKSELSHSKLGRAVIVAHREELITQPAERVLGGWNLPCPGIVMGDYKMTDARIISATMQTLASQSVTEEIFSHGKITHLVIDEAHKSPSRVYSEIIERFKAHNPDLRIVGVTATPQRLDGRGLSQIFEKVSYRLSTNDCIKRGILCPYKSMTASFGWSLKGVKKTKDGWDDKKIDELMTAANASEVIVKKWIEVGENRPTIAFISSVSQAESLAEEFNRNGIPAVFISGSTPKDPRRNAIKAYKNGEIKVICNDSVFTEGFDAPMTSCIVMAKPTRSGTIVAQAIGRGLRAHAAKQDCLILEFAPIDAPVDLFMVGDLLGKPKKQQKAESKAKEAGVILDVFGVDVSGEGWEAEPDKVVMEAVDIFSRGNNKKLAWTLDPVTKIATLAIGYGGALGIIPPHQAYVDALNDRCDNPKWRRWIAERAGWKLCRMVKNREIHVLGHFDTVEEAHQAAKEVLRKDDTWGRSRKAEWRGKPPTPKRQAFAQRLGVWRSGMTDGEASQAITAKLFINLANEKEIA